MSLRLVLSLVVFGWLLSSALAQDDPVVRGRKVSEWFKLIREDSDARRRLAALQLIDTAGGPKVSAVFPALARELREHPDVAVRHKIATLLPRYKDRGEEVVTALKTALADKEGVVRAAAATALGKLEGRQGFSAVPELVAALKDMHILVRAAAAETIGIFSRIDPEIAKDAIPALAELLKESEQTARFNATYALGRMGPAAEPAVSALAEALEREKDVAVRKELAKTLMEIGPTASAAAPALLKALTDAQVEIRQAAALALGKINPDASMALPALLKAAREMDKSVRCHAIHAIGNLGKGGLPAIRELIDILKQDDVAEVRLAVIEELARFGPDAKAAIDVLKVASRDGRPAIREAAQEALKRIQEAP